MRLSSIFGRRWRLATQFGPSRRSIFTGRSQRRTRGLALEPLEHRRLLSVVSISADDLGGNGSNNTLADEFRLVRNGGNLEVFIDGNLSQSLSLATLDGVSIAGSSDTDTVVIDLSGGLFTLVSGILFDGEQLGPNTTPNDTLVLTGDPGTTVGRVGYFSGPNLGDGSDDGLVLIDPGDSAGAGVSGVLNGDELSVRFFNLQPVIDTVPATQLDIFATNASETISVVNGPIYGGDQTATVSAATFESYSFANKKNVTVNALDGSDTFVLNYSVQVPSLELLDLYGNELTNGLLESDDALGETFQILATGPGTIANRMFGQNGADVYTNSATKLLDALQSDVQMYGQAGNSIIDLSDVNDASGDVITIEGNKIVGAAPAAIEVFFATIEDVRFEATSGDDQITILSTFAPFQYRISGGPGSDAFNVGSYDADPSPAVSLAWAPYGTGVNTIGQIKGALTIVPGPASDSGTDTLYVDDSGGLAGYGGAMINDAAGGAVLTRTTTLLGFDAAADIKYEYTPGGSELENLFIHTSQAADNLVVNTTSAQNTEINLGAGDDFVVIAGDYLSGANVFKGGDDADTIWLNTLNDLGHWSVLPLSQIEIEGNNPAGTLAGGDVVSVRELGAGVPRSLGFDYSGTGDVVLTGLALPVDIRTAEVVEYLGGSANDDSLSVTGTVADDLITVAPLSGDGARVFLGGDPWDGPAADGDFFDQYPGVAGGGAGPDLHLSGAADLYVDAAGGTANRLYFYAPSEADFADGPSVVVPGLGTGNAYDQISVTDSAVSVWNNSVGGLLPISFNSAALVQANPTDRGLVVNAGFEASPDVGGLADDIDVTPSSLFAIMVNGGNPVPTFAPNGDRLQFSAFGDLDIWADKGGTVSLAYSGGGTFPVDFSSIEDLSLFVGGTVNLYGDNNDPGVDQNDLFEIVGTGYQSFSLSVNGSPTIELSGVTDLHIFGDDALGTPSTGSNDVDTLNVTPFADNSPTGWGINISFDEGNPVDGTGAVPDPIIYNGLPGISENIELVPTGPGDGQLRVTNAADGLLITVINYTSNTGFIINGNDGSAGDTDALVISGTDGADDFIVQNADTVDVTGIFSVDFSNFSVVTLRGRAGLDSFTVNPDNPEIIIDGGVPEGSLQSNGDRLTVVTGGASFSIILGPEGDQGTVTVTGEQPISFDHLETLEIDGVVYTLPDLQEPNDSLDGASVLGSLPHLTIQDLTIHTTQVGTTNADYFQITARDTGVMVVNVLFERDGVAGNLTLGELGLEVLDGAGNVVATGTATSLGVQVAFPVVSQERYYLRVFSTDKDPNTYTLEVENFAAPMPTAVSLHPAFDTGRDGVDGITNADNPTLLIQAWLADFAAKGIPVLTAAQAAAGTPGVAVEVFINGVSAGFADPFGPSNNVFSFAMPAGLLAAGVPGGYTGYPNAHGWMNFVSAAVRVFDPQVAQATDARELGVPAVVTYDPNTPDITVASLSLNPASDSGIAGDGITKVSAPTFGGVAEANAIVRLYANGQLVGQAVAGADLSDGVAGNGLGAWSITSQSLVDGAYTFAITEEDVAGNVTNIAQSPTVALTIDATPPQIPTIDLQDTDDTGRSDLDNVTIGDPTQTPGVVDVRISAEPGSTVWVKDGETVIAAFLFDNTFDLTDGLADGFGILTIDFNANQLAYNIPAQGPHPLTVESIDVAGNARQSEQLLVTVDFTAPAPPTINLAPYSDSGTPGDGVTNVSAPAFYGFAEANAIVRLYVDNGSGPVLAGWTYAHSDESDGNPTDGLGLWEITSEPLTDEEYTIWAEAEDLSGNISGESDLIGLEIDATPPQIPTIDLQDADDTGWHDKDNVTIGDPTQTPGVVDVRISAEPGSTVYIKDGNTIVDTFVFDGAFDLTDGLADGFGIRTVDFNANQLAFNIPAQGPHPLTVESTDVAGNARQSEQLLVTVDYTAPLTPSSPDLLPSSDSGAFDNDNVTRINAPAFQGVGEANTLVRIWAEDAAGQIRLVGQGTVGSDESDGDPANGLGVWEVTVEPLDDGVYDITAELEDQAGNISQWSEALTIEIDTYVPNTAYLDLTTGDDTGRSNIDNTTLDNTPIFTVGTSDPNEAIHLLANNLRYRIYDRTEGSGDVLIYDSGTLLNVNSVNTGPLGPLADGVHNLKLEVEDRAGNISDDFLLTVVVDTAAPPASFGEPGPADDGLHPDSDTGLVSIPATLTDRITSDTTPTLWGRTEADAIVRLYADVNGNGAIDAGEPFLGQTTAVPLDGNNAEPNGYWEITSAVDLNDPALFFAQDGLRRLLIQATDPAGNNSAVQQLDIWIDTQGPQVENVFITAAPAFNLFNPKPSDGPTPPVDQLSIRVKDLPNRATGWLYEALAGNLDPGHFSLVGDANGTIPIQSVAFVSDPVVDGSPASGTIVLGFAQPLPDDRFTLTVSDELRDPAGNRLDGESNAEEPQDPPLFPTGDGLPGGSFVARFTVDSRPEVGVWAAGSVWVDTNGNSVFDPDNLDHTNRDIIYALGFTSDDVFAGNFALSAGDTADGFDKLAAYGRVDGDFRWLVDTDNDGVPNINLVEPAVVNGLPFAGRFDDKDVNGDEVGAVTAFPSAGEPSYWYFDTNHDFQVDYTLTSQLRGYPVVGDFDGDGFDDMATWMDDTFQIDLANGVRRGWDGVADATFRFGFIGTQERPVAADMDQDGYDDLGLWVPNRSGQTPGEAGEWYFLVSGGQTLLNRIVVDPIQGWNMIEFTPKPFGNDIYQQFGDEFALPVVGNFDPPVVPQFGETGVTLKGTGNDDVLEIVAGDTAANWTIRLNGEAQVLDGALTTLTVNLGGGADRVVFTGTAGDDVLESEPGTFVFSGTGYAITVLEAETLTANMGAGNDSALLHDGVGDETVTVWPGLVAVQGDGYQVAVEAGEDVRVIADRGGSDVALLYDSTGDDVAEIAAGSLVLRGQAFRSEAEGFEFAHAIARSGGSDVAHFVGSAGVDEFVARPDYSTMLSGGLFRRAKGFASVDIAAPAGNQSWIKLVDGDGDDTFTGSPTGANLRGPGYDIAVLGVAYVHAYARGGGNDAAVLNGSDGDDRLIIDDRFAKLFGDGYFLRAKYFETVTVDTLGGADTAKVWDTPGDDTFTGGPNGFTLRTRKQAFQGAGLETIQALSTYGGQDAAYLYDSAGDDLFTGTPTRATLSGAGFLLRASAFDYVYAYSTGGRDVAQLTGSTGDDMYTGDAVYGKLAGPGFFLRTKNFAEVSVASGGGADIGRLTGSAGDDSAFADGVDFVLQNLNFVRSLNGFRSVQVKGTGGNDTAEVWNGTIQHELLPMDGGNPPVDPNAVTAMFQQFNRVSVRNSEPTGDQELENVDNITFLW